MLLIPQQSDPLRLNLYRCQWIILQSTIPASFQFSLEPEAIGTSIQSKHTALNPRTLDHLQSPPLAPI